MPSSVRHTGRREPVAVTIRLYQETPCKGLYYFGNGLDGHFFFPDSDNLLSFSPLTDSYSYRNV